MHLVKNYLNAFAQRLLESFKLYTSRKLQRQNTISEKMDHLRLPSVLSSMNQCCPDKSKVCVCALLCKILTGAPREMNLVDWFEVMVDWQMCFCSMVYIDFGTSSEFVPKYIMSEFCYFHYIINFMLPLI
ncbi:uncharacterized protein LOC108202689 isoform X1 [Daucus carota subsp. sativus]|uniref:uncharacterized protein LOC108202689 isoform X1 n=1 Tax=Daucus carota subsp. sativus TaxID=79200 RepID=UPI003082F225